MSEASEAPARKLTFLNVLALFGLAGFSAVFLGALFIGMSIDPRVDMHSRLVAYTASCAGLTGALVCNWALAVPGRHRKIAGIIALGMLVFTIAYGTVHLLPRS